MSIWSFEQVVLPEFENKLRGYFGESFEEAWHVISGATELFDEQKFRIELAELKQKYGEVLPEDMLNEMQTKYRYLGIYTPEEYGFTKEYVLNSFNNIDIKQTFTSLEELEDNKKIFEKLLADCKDGKIKEIMALVNFNVNIRTVRSEKLSFGFSLLTPFYDYLMKRMDFNRKEIGYLTKDEILNFLSSGIVAQKRSSHPGVIYFGRNNRLLTDEEKKMFEDVFGKNISVNELTGRIANKGIAQGKARIILSVSDLEQFEDGEILVSQFTRPEYMFAMKKCAAIVTNDGGITSHAAIVSRELNKPCIIGTKIATKVLKDGGLVEVDANKGIVKILNQ
jgi:phosphohistidine swiveling domain-containing protein